MDKTKYRGVSFSLYLSNEYPDWKPYLLWGSYSTIRFLWGWFSLHISINRIDHAAALPTAVEIERREKIKKKNKPYRGISFYICLNNQQGLTTRFSKK